MRLLLDSSGAALVCALADAEGVVIERRHAAPGELSRDIGRAAGELLGELNVRDLDHVAVGLGPGSFIGTRMAISYANGLAAAGGVALRGVHSLAAIAAVHGGGRTVVLRDAKRGELYCYGHNGGDCVLVALAELPRLLTQHGVEAAVVEEPGAGDAKQALRRRELLELLAHSGIRLVQCDGVPAEGLRRLAGSAPASDYVEPVYLRGFL